MTVDRPLDGFLRRVLRYGRSKQRALHLAAWLEGECERDGWSGPYEVPSRKQRAYLALKGCGSYLEFRQYITRPDLPVRLHAGMFCQQPKLCGLCAIRRSTKLLRSYVPKLAQLVDGGAFVSMLTLTAKNGPALGERYDHLDGSLRRIMKDGWRSANGHVKRWHPWALFLGAVFSYEFKRGRRSQEWHPHAHGLVVTKAPIESDQSWDIRTRWCEDLQDADVRAQDLRPLRSLMEIQPEAASEGQVADGLGNDLVEVFKYPLKFSGMEPADQWHAAETVKGRHLIRPFGCLRGIKVDASYLDDLLDVGELPYLQLLLRYCTGREQYQVAEQILVDSSVKKG